jgi:hypothetical protein
VNLLPPAIPWFGFLIIQRQRVAAEVMIFELGALIEFGLLEIFCNAGEVAAACLDR